MFILLCWSVGQPKKKNAPTPLTALVFADVGWNLEFGMEVKSVCDGVCLCFMTIG